MKDPMIESIIGMVEDYAPEFDDKYYDVKSTEYVIEAARSQVRSGFDAENHATQLMNHETWYKNHYSYGVKSAKKRHEKGTFDSEKNEKMGFNLSKLGDARLGTKLNAAEHKAVGALIAKHIENDIKESIEDLTELTDKQKAEIAKRKAMRQGKVAKAQAKKAATKTTVAPAKTTGSDSHIIMQLRSAQDLGGDKEIQFRRGSAKVDPKHIDAVLKAHDQLEKSYDKRRLRLHVMQSHDHLKKIAKMLGECIEDDEFDGMYAGPARATEPQNESIADMNVGIRSFGKAGDGFKTDGRFVVQTPGGKQYSYKPGHPSIKKIKDRIANGNPGGLTIIKDIHEGYNDSPGGDRITTHDNPLVVIHDDSFKKGRQGISGHMNLKTFMNIHGIAAKHQGELVKAVHSSSEDNKHKIADHMIADYHSNYKNEGRRAPSVWIHKSEHHDSAVEEDKKEYSGNANNPIKEEAHTMPEKGATEANAKMQKGNYNREQFKQPQVEVTDGDINNLGKMMGDAKNMPGKITCESTDEENEILSHSDEHPAGMGDKYPHTVEGKDGKKKKNVGEKAAADLGKEETKTLQTNESYEYEIVKEGFTYKFTISNDEEIIHESVSATLPGAEAQIGRFLKSLDEENCRKEGQKDRVRKIVNKYTNS